MMDGHLPFTVPLTLWNKSDFGQPSSFVHSDGLDQFQTSGPTKTPYAEWTDLVANGPV